MTKIENNEQVVKKEVFKLFPRYIRRLDTTSLSKSADALVDELIFTTYLGAIGKNRGEQIKDVNLIEFKYFLKPHKIRAVDYVFTINSLRNAVQELEAKGYLVRDKDGFLMLAQGDV